MLTIEVIATILLATRLVSVFFIVKIIILQYRLFGTQIDFSLVPNLTKMQRKHIYMMRRILFALSLIILAGNIIPIIIDIVTLLPNFETNRPSVLHPLSIMYAVSSASTSLLSAVTIQLLYKLAGFTPSKDN